MNTQKHTLSILSSHDVSAVCTCGQWKYTSPGALTQDTSVRMEEEFQRHLLNYSASVGRTRAGLMAHEADKAMGRTRKAKARKAGQVEVLEHEAGWLNQNIAAVTIASTVCETNGHPHTAKVLAELAQEMRENLARIREALKGGGQ